MKATRSFLFKCCLCCWQTVLQSNRLHGKVQVVSRIVMKRKRSRPSR